MCGVYEGPIREVVGSIDLISYTRSRTDQPLLSLETRKTNKNKDYIAKVLPVFSSSFQLFLFLGSSISTRASIGTYLLQAYIGDIVDSIPEPHNKANTAVT